MVHYYIFTVSGNNLIFNHNRLFETAPGLKNLFPFKTATPEGQAEGLKKHGLQVMESIDGAIDLLDDPEQLEETLLELGIVHNMKSVQLESFGVS